MEDRATLALNNIVATNLPFGDRVLKIVDSIVRQNSREKPADGLLRAELKRQRELSPETARDVARAVFTIFRWRGWIDPSSPMREQLPEALALQKRFETSPASFTNDELLAHAVPEWIHSAMDVSADWVRALQSEPRLWLRARRGMAEQVSFALGDCRISSQPALADCIEYQGAQDLFRTPGFHAGEFELQDISSQIVGLICAPKPGETWWDACAGEGGKMLHLSDLMQNKGLIWASDRADWRLKRLKLRAARSKAFNYRSVIWDGGAKPPTKTMFDGVLIDAPCSGVGTWQRNPHARWTTTANDVAELASVQKQMLRTAAGSVKPGGRLIYSVCTLTRAETTEVAAEFQNAFPEFAAEPILNPLNETAPAQHHLWLWPSDGGNGMLIAAWRREKKTGRQETKQT